MRKLLKRLKIQVLKKVVGFCRKVVYSRVTGSEALKLPSFSCLLCGVSTLPSSLVGLRHSAMQLEMLQPPYLHIRSHVYQLPSSGFSTSVNFLFFFFFPSAIATSSVQILTFRKIFLFLCHTKTYNVYLTKQLNVTIKTYLIMVPSFSCLSQHSPRSCSVYSFWPFLVDFAWCLKGVKTHLYTGLVRLVSREFLRIQFTKTFLLTSRNVLNIKLSREPRIS